MTTNYTIPARAVRVTVNDIDFLVWGDFTHRGTIAYNTETEEAQWIREGGYLTNELTIRRAIAITFGLPLYRTKKAEKTETTVKAKKVLTEEQKAKKAARAKARREARKAQANV